MDELIFRIWLFAFLFLAAIGPLVMWRSRSLIEKISARNPGWVTADASDTFAYISQQMRSWSRIMTGDYAGLDQDLQGSCRTLRVGSSVYLVCLFTALGGQMYYILSGG